MLHPINIRNYRITKSFCKWIHLPPLRRHKSPFLSLIRRFAKKNRSANAEKEKLSSLMPKPPFPSFIKRKQRQMQDQSLHFNFVPYYPYRCPISHKDPPRNPTYSLLSERLSDRLTRLEAEAAILRFAKAHLPLQGVLQATPQGLCYLSLPEKFLTLLFPLLPNHPLQLPPSQLATKPLEAYIEVVLPKEQPSLCLGQMPINKTFSFELEGCYQARPRGFAGIESVYFLRIRSTELEQLRLQHCLPATIPGYPFHCLLAVKQGHCLPNQGFYRANPCDTKA